MSSNRRKSVRRALGYGAKIVAPDGSWGRDCRVIDVSDGGARLALAEPADLPRNFVLALSERGGAARRCRVVWTTDGEIGVTFERRAPAV
jgi:hypothetical protein